MIYFYYYTAGLLSFLTPCVLPLLPFFISSTLGFNKDKLNKKRVIYKTLSFCLGFILCLSILAMGISLLSNTLSLYKNFIEIIAGIIILFFSLYYLDLIDIPYFNKQKLYNKATFKSEYLNSFWMGLIFSITWSPCLSPVMASVLTYISVNNIGPLYSVLKMFFFSLGLASPLIFASFFWDTLSSFIKNNPSLPLIIKKVLGAFILIFSLNIIFSSSLKKDNIFSDLSFNYNENTVLVVVSIDCTHCEESIQSLKKIKEHCKDIKLDYLDINHNDAYKVISKYGILGAPTYLFFDNNSELLDMIDGHIEEEELIKTINSLFNTNCKI